MLDERHISISQRDGDSNSYTYGRIGDHNVVMATLPAGRYGTTPAATAAMHMKNTFPSFRFGLMVGVGGGIPLIDIRLGDVAVSQPHGRTGGVIQWDRGEDTNDGVGQLNSPPTLLLTALSNLRSEHRLQQTMFDYIQRLASDNEDYRYPGVEQDTLYGAEYHHVGDEGPCLRCDPNKAVQRAPRASPEVPHVFYGNILSGNKVMKHSSTRDYLGKELQAICFEMEAAGLMNDFPCLVIRGICDYSDSHKYSKWQLYASATAAAFAKALLLHMAPQEVLQQSANPQWQQSANPQWQQCPTLPVQPIYDQGLKSYQPQLMNQGYFQRQPQSQTPPQLQPQSSPPQDYALMMVEQGYGHLRPKLEDPMPADADNILKNILLAQRYLGFWTWSQESNSIYGYQKAQRGQAQKQVEMARARRIHG